MSAEPWYKDGLQFTCTQCGHCCSGPPGVVWVTDEDIQAIAEHRGRTVGEIRLFHTRPLFDRVSLTEFANGDCTFLDPATRRCTIYPVRPTQCRTWPFWPSNLASPAEWQRVQEVCPGTRGGAIIPLEEIERQAAQLDI